MAHPPATPETVIVLARDQAAFYEFLRDRQGRAASTVVILDRRRGDRRRRARRVPVDRRRAERRRPAPAAALALLSVLGFMILHRGEEGWEA